MNIESDLALRLDPLALGETDLPAEHEAFLWLPDEPPVTPEQEEMFAATFSRVPELAVVQGALARKRRDAR